MDQTDASYQGHALHHHGRVQGVLQPAVPGRACMVRRVRCVRMYVLLSDQSYNHSLAQNPYVRWDYEIISAGFTANTILFYGEPDRDSA